ncbi:ADP-ribosylglycohydrolase family protein [Solibacillus sp. FSL K6-1554]|uniref:ADP-ribosylglycohydrolase family protein n=1 Tax=Solibacillus sp. FSL K6-1554 TaxID=2921472 RepID=UPI0030F9B3EA
MNITQDKIFLDKYLGGLLASAIGDALGWPQEQNAKNRNPEYTPKIAFRDWIRESGSRFHLHEEPIKAGEYSDDTQLMLATARSLLKKEKWYVNFAKVELPFWLLYERGGGGATKRSCKSWAKGKSPWNESDIKLRRNYFNAGGNGVVMRILPHVYHSATDREKMRYDIFRNGIATHGHPRALVSSLIYAEALLFLITKSDTLKYAELIDYLIDNENLWKSVPEFENMNDWRQKAEEIYNESYLKIWENTISELREGLVELKFRLKNGLLDNTNETLKKLGCFDKSVNGSGVNSVLIAFYIFSKFATNPQTGILEVAFLKNADTDTLASLVGGLFGSLYGTDWIPLEWCKVQDMEYFKYVVSRMSEPKPEQTVMDVWKESKKKKLIDNLKNRTLGSQFKFFVLDGLILKDKHVNKNVESNKKFLIETFKLESTAGQTIYIKSISNKPADKPTQNSNFKKASFNEERIQYINLVRINHLLPNISLRDTLEIIQLFYNSNESKINDFLKKFEVSNSKQTIKEELRSLILNPNKTSH